MHRGSRLPSIRPTHHIFRRYGLFFCYSDFSPAPCLSSDMLRSILLSVEFSLIRACPEYQCTGHQNTKRSNVSDTITVLVNIIIVFCPYEFFEILFNFFVSFCLAHSFDNLLAPKQLSRLPTLSFLLHHRSHVSDSTLPSTQLPHFSKHESR